MLHRTAIAGLTMMLAATLAAPASAHPRAFRTLAMMEGIAVDPPRGYVTMCAQDRGLCAALSATDEADIASTDQRLRLLRQVNRFVNQHVRQASDEETVGEPDVWRRPGVGRSAAGDCEDLAIEKRLRLIAAGYPPADLYFAVGLARGLGMHAVLVARTAQGDVVLDSLSPAILLWSDTPYIWVSRQAPGKPDRWESAMPLLPDAAQTQMASVTRYSTTTAESDGGGIQHWQRAETPLAGSALLSGASFHSRPHYGVPASTPSGLNNTADWRISRADRSGWAAPLPASLRTDVSNETAGSAPLR
jgi:predicted transglutaminase-like cysteine proteinase